MSGEHYEGPAGNLIAGDVIIPRALAWRLARVLGGMANFTIQCELAGGIVPVRNLVRMVGELTFMVEGTYPGIHELSRDVASITLASGQMSRAELEEYLEDSRQQMRSLGVAESDIENALNHWRL